MKLLKCKFNANKAEIGAALNLEHIYDESGIVIQESEFTENVAS